MSRQESNTPLIERLEEFFERGLKYFSVRDLEQIGSSPDSHIGVVEGSKATSVLNLNCLQKNNAVHGARVKAAQ
jgi:hypothetical protein